MKTITQNLLVFLMLGFLASPLRAQQLSGKISGKMDEIGAALDQIPQMRKTQLDQTAWTISQDYESDQKAAILLVDSENTGLSQLAQVWLQSAFYYFGINRISVYSGGLDPGELTVEALSVLEPWGYRIRPDKKEAGTWLVDYGTGRWELQSKKYDSPVIPGTPYLTVFLDAETASTLKDNTGATLEIPLLYEASGADPAQPMYDALNSKVASEMFYIAYRTKLNLENL